MDNVNCTTRAGLKVRDWKRQTVLHGIESCVLPNREREACFHCLLGTCTCHVLAFLPLKALAHLKRYVLSGPKYVVCFGNPSDSATHTGGHSSKAYRPLLCVISEIITYNINALSGLLDVLPVAKTLIDQTTCTYRSWKHKYR